MPAALGMLLRAGRLRELLLSVGSCTSVGLGVAVWWDMGLRDHFQPALRPAGS